MPDKTIQPTLESVSWQELRGKVYKVNPDLAEKIDACNPSKEFKLIKANYLYGQYVLNNGTLQIPYKDKLRSIKDTEVDPKLRDALSYAITMPVGVVLNKSLELFLSSGERTIPFAFMKPGKVFMLWSIFELTDSAHVGNIWSISAGARTIMMVPKVSDKANFERVKREFQLDSSPPRSMKNTWGSITDQWRLFAELANSERTFTDWQTELLFFTKDWIDKIIKADTPCWRELKNFLLSSVWKETSFLRNNVLFEYAFSRALQAKNISKPNPYIKDTVKQLYAMSSGFYPGLVFAGDDLAAPIKVLKTVFDEIYETKYLPSIVHPDYLSTDKPCYYSLMAPTLMEFSPRSRNDTSKINDLRDMGLIMQRTSDYILEDHLQLKGTPIYSLANQVSYRYFHTSPSQWENSIISTTRLIDYDITLQNESKQYPHLHFACTSPFVRGLIQLNYKSTHHSVS